MAANEETCAYADAIAARECYEKNPTPANHRAYRKASETAGDQRTQVTNWPLHKALKSSDDELMLQTAIELFRIYESVQSEPLLGGSGWERGLLQVDQKTWIDPKTGETAYKGARQLTGERFDTDFAPVGSDGTPREWHGDSVFDDLKQKAIDEKLLPKIEAELGPLKGPIEELVMGAATLRAVGERYSSATGQVAGKVGKGYADIGLRTVYRVLANTPGNRIHRLARAAN
ncbi:hypothetical protein [Microbaculum marinum]|uniref:Uncharacterized protein n=1 Tax=Microbaculum marinum TaxID=1764581 RepID=A0AAW9RY91_9HYPH